MMNQEHRRPITLEDLLRLKRAERPPAEFWSQFDRELRAKQLSALVEKRPWWRTLPRRFGTFSRYHLPLGATAILALSVLTVREYRSPASPLVSPTARSENQMAVSESVAVARGHAATVAPGVAGAQEVSAGAPVENEASTQATSFVLASEATEPGHLSQIIPVLGAAPHSSDFDRDATPTARFIAANLAIAKASEPAVVQNLLGASHGFEARAMPARTQVVEPLAQMASPADVRRSRLLNAAVASVSMNSVAPAHNIEARVRRLSNEQLYDSISQFDAHGNSVLIKF